MSTCFIDAIRNACHIYSVVCMSFFESFIVIFGIVSIFILFSLNLCTYSFVKNRLIVSSGKSARGVFCNSERSVMSSCAISPILTLERTMSVDSYSLNWFFHIVNLLKLHNQIVVF